MGNQFLESCQIERSRGLGLDPFVEIGPVDLDRKRPGKYGLSGGSGNSTLRGRMGA
jgi:hypothetical protein